MYVVTSRGLAQGAGMRKRYVGRGEIAKGFGYVHTMLVTSTIVTGLVKGLVNAKM